MQLDSEDHRRFLLEMIKQVTFPGHLLDLAHEVKKSISDAAVVDDTIDKDKLPAPV